ncbi:response regulator [Nibricoccus aquaticus]|uniref:Response regulator n=1 Tax=Nibricoccus aquaticus TaxID=2576891 RepID=A0A290Q742_9BACT|nr:response regulator [Nibricoccus aquaticus]ATC62990.1 response regulator [Nibricoccus aquaticus]
MKRTVLAIDDALTMRKLVSFTLRTAGLDVVEAPDGADAIELLKTRSFDLIITDVNMPRLNGIEFTRQARQLPHGKTVPILMLTTESDPEKKNLARAAGASGWIVKPFQQEQLLAVVGKVLPGAIAPAA